MSLTKIRRDELLAALAGELEKQPDAIERTDVDSEGLAAALGSLMHNEGEGEPLEADYLGAVASLTEPDTIRNATRAKVERALKPPTSAELAAKDREQAKKLGWE